MDTLVRLCRAEKYIYKWFEWVIWMPWGADTILTGHRNLINGHIVSRKWMPSSLLMLAMIRKHWSSFFCPDQLKVSRNVNDTTEVRTCCLYLVDGMYWVSAATSKQKENLKAAPSDFLATEGQKNKLIETQHWFTVSLSRCYGSFVSKRLPTYTSSRHTATSN